MGTYNCNGLTNERLSWLIGSRDGTQLGLGFDFLALTECHGGEWLADVRIRLPIPLSFAGMFLKYEQEREAPRAKINN
jgi:hypothetical protein